MKRSGADALYCRRTVDAKRLGVVDDVPRQPNDGRRVSGSPEGLCVDDEWVA